MVTVPKREANSFPPFLLPKIDKRSIFIRVTINRGHASRNLTITINILAPILLVCIGVALVVYNKIQLRKVRKHVLKTIKELNIEDELANCICGVNAKLFIAIKTYLREHRMPDPFVGQGSALEMTLIIAELREKGKIK